jgi:hypothetical protein
LTGGLYRTLKINNKALQNEWNYFFKLPFPENPEDKELEELFDELVLLDLHIAGIVSSFLKGVKVDKKLVYIDEEFNNKIKALEPLNSDPRYKDWIAITKYKVELDKMIKMVLVLWDE